jgi:hypothetical protein
MGRRGQEEPHGEGGCAACMRSSTGKLNDRNDGNHACETECTPIGKVVSDENAVGRKLGIVGCVPSGGCTVGQGITVIVTRLLAATKRNHTVKQRVDSDGVRLTDYIDPGMTQ